MGKHRFVFLMVLSLLPAQQLLSSIHDKSRAGIFYNYGFAPKVSRFIDRTNQLDLSSFHYGGLQVDVPHNRYLAYGFSFDVMLVQSPKWVPDYMNPTTMTRSHILGLGLSGLLKPQIPITIPWGDFWGYFALEAGFGGSPALVMGNYNLSKREFKNFSNFPSAFPLVLNSALQAGFEFYLSELIGMQLGAGYRALWFIHPFTDSREPQPSLPKADESFLIYDASAFFANASIKLAF